MPQVTEKTLNEYGIMPGDPRLRAIAVTIGPGQERSLNIGIKYAQVIIFCSIIKNIESCIEIQRSIDTCQSYRRPCYGNLTNYFI